ncbi:MAG: tetratricopeptide repeat protein [Candidatus Aminicenantes bacterium]|nr:MAG: tetratricopeptide repeat protein [Candidatus Aminicenantes bacterium]
MADKRVAILKRANKLFRQGKADAAVKEYKKILEIKPDDLEVRRIVGDLELKQNNTKGAIVQFEWIADHYLKEGFFAKAIAMYKRITRVDPNYEQALFKLAELYTKQGLVMEAKQIFLDIAEECKRKNNQKKALDMYKKILEFDRSNIKMRLLLADNYLKEGLEDNAISEYITAADIILNKKDYHRAEELLLNTMGKTKNLKVIEKLVQLYVKQGEDDKAITLINKQGMDFLQDVEMLKVLGELYLKKNMMTEAEKIFSKIADLDPGETEVIMRLGKVYMQREDYDRTYSLFLPIIDKNVQNKKFEEAGNLLRFIIASNNSYLPALKKLAEIFNLTGKTNNLIALYESMIPIYEEKQMKVELRGILEELIQLSDTPFSYEEQLAKLTGQEAREAEAAEEEVESEREKEFVNYNLRAAEKAIEVSDFDKAIDTLKKSKSNFPKNIELRKKLFEVYLEAEQTELAVEEGKGLLELYKFLHHDDEYIDLLEKLSTLKPEDERLVALSVDEKTSIDIDFGKAELDEQILEIGDSYTHEEPGAGDAGDDVLVLSEAENVTAAPMVEGEASSKSLSSILSEVDFYVNDGYFGDAEKLLNQLKEKYPGNKQLLAKIDKLEKAKMGVLQDGDSASTGMGLDFEIERSQAGPQEKKPAQKPGVRERTERIRGERPFIHGEEEMIHQGADSNIEINLNVDRQESPSSSGIKFSEEDFADSGIPDSIPLDMDLEMEPEPGPEPEEPELELEKGMELGREPGSRQGEGTGDVFELDPTMSADSFIPPTMPEMPPSPPGPPEELPEPEELMKPESEPESISGDDLFEMESPFAEEGFMAQEYEDSKSALKVHEQQLQKPGEIKPKPEPPVDDDIDLEIELEEGEESGDVPLMEVDTKGKVTDDHSSSAIEDIDLDSIMITNGEEAVPDLDTPFKEVTNADLAFESHEELLKDEVSFLDEAYFEVEQNIKDEMEAISHWLKELEKQRTSTIEKNMMEIFEEFKKGVDEKIGQEDYDTRYNLGIAYKEMGLVEEAIHEFLISAKHPSKFFDSAGLLGMCFREKGMFDEAITWFEKALDIQDRRKEEYLAIKYELVITLKLKEDYKKALKFTVDILKEDQGYRDAKALYKEMRSLIGQ